MDTFELENGVVLQGCVSVSASADALFAARELTLVRGDVLLVADAAFSLQRGHCYGLAGENGCGKSTLLRALVHIIESETEGGISVVYVGQDDAERAAASPYTVLEHCMRGAARIMRLREELAILEGDSTASDSATATRLADVLSELDLLDADGLADRAKEALRALSFAEDAIESPVSKLSGGWRTRLELARALLSDPDVLFLDEPTNHLDLHATLRLAGILRRRVTDGMTVVLVSHDAAFLDIVCTDMLSLSMGVLMAVTGNYAAFEERAEEYRAHHERIYAERVRIEEKSASSTEKQRAVARRAGDDKALKQAASRERKAAQRAGLYREDGKRYKLRSIAKLDISALRLPSRAMPVNVHRGVTLSLPEYAAIGSVRPGEMLCGLRDATLGYTPGKPVLTGVTVSICAGDRIALVGENGSGKSTLLQGLASRLKTGAGARARVVLVDQNHLAAIAASGELSAVDFLSRQNPGIFKDVTAVRAYLARFGLGGSGGSSAALQPIGTLSGGLRVRVMLADAFAGDVAPDVVLLDEPTNHLDAETITALAGALETFPGAVIAVSHNCAFLLALCRDLWITGPRASESGKHETGTPSTVIVQRSTERTEFLENFRAFAEKIVPKGDRGHIAAMLTVRFMRHSAIVHHASALTTLVV
jgi:ATP-binding cassette, subfamily F, member 3